MSDNTSEGLQTHKGSGEDGWWQCRAAWEDPVSMVNTPAARGRIKKQMGHREKRVSVWSDIRRSLHPIRAAQEAQADWDWWHQTAALQLWINEEKKQNNKSFSVFHPQGSGFFFCLMMFVCIEVIWGWRPPPPPNPLCWSAVQCDAVLNVI